MPAPEAQEGAWRLLGGDVPGLWGAGAIANASEPDYRCYMQVEKLKYVIWANELDRAVRFYCEVFDAQIVRRSGPVSRRRRMSSPSHPG
jgi:hypothetical protein